MASRCAKSVSKTATLVLISSTTARVATLIIIFMRMRAPIPISAYHHVPPVCTGIHTRASANLAYRRASLVDPTLRVSHVSQIIPCLAQSACWSVQSNTILVAKSALPVNPLVNDALARLHVPFASLVCISPTILLPEVAPTAVWLGSMLTVLLGAVSSAYFHA
jgi:hypothetical protein